MANLSQLSYTVKKSNKSQPQSVIQNSWLSLAAYSPFIFSISLVAIPLLHTVKHPTKLIGMKKIDDFENKEMQLLQARNYLHFNEESEICYHHEKPYLIRYESIQKSCLDIVGIGVSTPSKTPTSFLPSPPFPLSPLTSQFRTK